MATRIQSNSKTEESDVVSTARARLKLAIDAENTFRIRAKEDLEFRAGEQWDPEIKASRARDQRPCLTINKLPQFIRQVTNDQRQNRPSIKVSPVDNAADVDTAKIFQGIIKHIEYNSRADVAYDRGFESAVTKGLGYFRVITDYADPFSFNQEILIKSIKDADAVYLDPFYQEPDGSDANWGLIVSELSHEDYKAQYGEKENLKLDVSEWSELANLYSDWISKDSIKVVEYFYKTFKEVEILQLNDGSVIKADQPIPQGLSVVKKRKTTLPAIKWAKVSCVDELETTDWLGSWIPIIPVPGDEIVINSERIFEGLIRHAKDSQKMYNFWKSAETETIALAPRAPWVGFEGQFEGHENKWQTANTKNHAFLEVKPVSIGGQPAGLPQRNVFEPPIMAITQAGLMASDDIKSTTGIYDSSLGARSNEQSGIAIQRRANQSQVANFHFVDNLSRSIRHLGRILVELIPQIYDTPQVIRTMNEDGTVEMVKINQIFDKNGEQKIFNLGIGKYDVTVETGPSYQTKRQEAVIAMLEFTKALPQQAANVADLIAKNMDWPGASEFAERFKKMLPPNLQDQKEGEEPQLPPEAQAQLQQMDGMIKALTEQLNSAQDKLDNKTMELESKERIEMAKLQTQAEIELAKMGSVESLALLKAEIAQLENRLNTLGFQEPFQNQDQNGAGPQSSALPQPNQQQLTGEFPPGQNPGELL